MFSGIAWSQDQPGSTAGSTTAADEGRLLGGHRFIPSEFVPGPFITTAFTTLTGLGFASAAVNVTGATYNLGALSESMRLQVAQTSWLALRLGAAGILFSGIDQDAALNFGATFGYNVVAGASAGWRFDRLRVAGSLDVGTSQSYTFNILSAIQQSVAASMVNASTLLTGVNTFTVAPGAQVAYGFSPTLGGFGHVQFAYANATSGSVSQGSTALEAGGGASIDLAPANNVPIGFLVAYNLEVGFPPGGADSTASHQLAGGVFYTGRPDLALGVEGRVSRSSPSPQVNLTVIEVIFGMHYFW